MYAIHLVDGARIECHDYERRDGGIRLGDDRGERLGVVPGAQPRCTLRETMDRDAGECGVVWRPERD